MRRFAVTSLLASLAIVAAGTGLAVSATAVDATAPTSKLLQVADLKPFGGAKKPVKQTFSVDAQTTDEVNSVCVNAKGQPLTFPDATGWVAGGQTKGKGYRSVSEHVRDYGTAQAAAAAWNALTSAVAGCAPSAREQMTAGNPREYYAITQAQQPVANGGLAVVEISRAVSKDPQVNGSTTATYTVFRQAGTAIIETALYLNPGAAVQPGQVAAVNDLSTTLAARWSGVAVGATPSASATASATPSATPSASASR